MILKEGLEIGSVVRLLHKRPLLFLKIRGGISRPPKEIYGNIFAYKNEWKWKKKLFP